MDFFKNLLGNKIRKVDLTGLFENWITKININSSLDEEIVAINFGIFESENGYMVYITGSNEYDPDDDDWASEINFEPSQNLKYFNIPSELTKDIHWEEVQSDIESTLKKIIAQNKDLNLFKNRRITTGFDDGNLVRIA